MTCRSGCPTPGAHANWGDCARAASLQIGDLGHGVKRATDTRLNAYAKAKSLGLQPQGTKLSQSEGLMRAVGA